jgi:hypothetical protein
MPPGGNPNDHPSDSDTRPFLCIPYWTTPLAPGGSWDTGETRPLPGAVVSYACESIRSGPYKPGEKLDVTVEVRNSGGGNSTALASVVVYWANPSVGFAKPNFFAASIVAVAPTRNAPGSTPTATMTATIPATAPDHICLVVSVSHAQDRAGTACDPVHDRHWAQRNLQAVTAAVGAPAIVPLMAANPFNTAMSFDLRVGPVDERLAHQVANAFHTAPSGIRARVRLLDDHGAAVSEDGEQAQISVDLRPLEQRQFQIMIEIDTDVPQGQSAAVEVGLHDHSHDRGLVGSLGVVLLPPGTG